jgi:hypothetical protein
MALGPTGDFPRGKLNEGDEGGLKLQVVTTDRTVVIAFGKDVSWIGMTKATALELAAAILKSAQSIGD